MKFVFKNLRAIGDRSGDLGQGMKRWRVEAMDENGALVEYVLAFAMKQADATTEMDRLLANHVTEKLNGC